MKLGLQLGYWGAQPPADARDKVLEAEKLGFDTVFAAESWGSDAFTPLAWWGSETQRIRLGTSIVQMSARTPTSDLRSWASTRCSPPSRGDPTPSRPSPGGVRRPSASGWEPRSCRCRPAPPRRRRCTL